MDDFIRFQIKLNILMSSTGRQIQKDYEMNFKKLKFNGLPLSERSTGFFTGNDSSDKKSEVRFGKYGQNYI